MKKIIHIITGLNDGGAEAVLHRLCAIDKASYHVVISLMDEGKYGPLLREAGIEVYCLNMPQGRVTLSGLWQLLKVLRKCKPDVVQTWMYHADMIGGVVAKFAGVKNIVWGVHHTTLLKGESKRSTIYIARINAFLSHFVPNKIIYCAEKSREVQEFIGFKRSKGVVVPNGYNISDFQPSEEGRSSFRKEFGIEDDVFLIGHVGRYDPQKDHKNLVEAIAEVEQKRNALKVVLVGSNLDNANHILVAKISEHNLINDFMLIGRRNDIPNVMNGFDLFVLSSAFGEAFPNVLNEAMACGTPCVTTDVGDAGVIVGDIGWIVEPRNPQQLAIAIENAIHEFKSETPAWLARKAAARNRIVENFSIEKMMEGYHGVWFGK